MSDDDLRRAQTLIRALPDYPEPGVTFRDITPLLADASALRTTVEAMIEPFAGIFDVVAGVEARGFLLAGAVAIAAGVGLVPIRKAGKLPRPTASVSYDLEYGSATIEAQEQIRPGVRLLLVDDVLATGGTLQAAHTLVRQLGAQTVGTSVLMEIEALGGRARCGDVHALFRV